MPTDDHEAFAKIVNGQSGSEIVELLAYARFAHARHRWIEHITDRDGARPSTDAERQWIADQPDHIYDDALTGALAQVADAAVTLAAERIQTAKDDFEEKLQLARERMAQDIEIARAEAVDAKVVKDVKSLVANAEKAGGFGRQLLLAVIAAVLSPVILGLIYLGAINQASWIPEGLRLPPQSTSSGERPL